MTNKKLVIAGGSGFIGSHLISSAAARGAEIVVLTRHPEQGSQRQMRWDGETVGDWASELENATAVINLSGASIEKKWTAEHKRDILNSRIRSTRAIGDALMQCSNPPKAWINASAIGIYGDRGDQPLAESARPGDGFLAEVGQKWEEACLSYSLPEVNQVVIRTGLVLGKDGGLFPILKRLTSFGLGGRIGSGRQYMSWIHIDDLVGLYIWAIQAGLQGPVNATAPDPVTNSEFMGQLREQIGRPPAPPAPALAVELLSGLMGKQGSLLLQGQRVYPVIAEANGFQFAFPSLDLALVELLG